MIARSLAEENPVSKILLWGLFIGQRYHAVFPAWLAAIRQIGGWSGKIVVISDVDRPETEGVTHVNMVGRFASLRPRNVDPTADHGAQSMKTLISDAVDTGAFDYLFFIDADVLVCSSRFPAILEMLTSSGKIAVQRDIRPISSKATCTGWKFLNQAERARFANDSINSGLVGVPTRGRQSRILSDWQAANIAAGMRGNDQHRLTLLLLRKYDGRWCYVPETAHGRDVARLYKPAQVEANPGEITFAHFTGGGSRLGMMLEHARTVLNLAF